MYDVFVNKKLLRIDKNSDSSFDLEVNYSGIKQLESFVEKLEAGDVDSILLLSDHPDEVIKDFSKIAEVRVAAGGKVKNKQGDVLFIFREGVWDLPKGFVEQGESLEQGAIREVEEETGVLRVEIIDKIKTTYHTYRYKGKLVLKISHWFDMKTSSNDKLVPQVEEGITDVQWLDNAGVKSALKNTWENIKLLF